MMFRAISRYLLAFHLHLGDRVGLALRGRLVHHPHDDLGSPPALTVQYDEPAAPSQISIAQVGSAPCSAGS